MGKGGVHVAIPTNVTGKRAVGLHNRNTPKVGNNPTNSLCVAFIVPSSPMFGHLKGSLCVRTPLDLCATMLNNRRAISALGNGMGLGMGPRARGKAGIHLGNGNFPICGRRNGFNSLVMACGIAVPDGLARRRGRLFHRLGSDDGWGGEEVVRASLVVVGSFYSHYRISPSFVVRLRRSKLVRIQIVSRRHCLPASRLTRLRHCARLCCSLSVGVTKVSTVRRVLRHVRLLRRRIHSLEGRLRFCHWGPYPRERDRGYARFSFQRYSFAFVFLFLPLFLCSGRRYQARRRQFSSRCCVCRRGMVNYSTLSSFFRLFSCFFPLCCPAFGLGSLSL